MTEAVIKRPFYKRWWFLGIAGFFLFVLVVGAFGSSSEVTTVTSETGAEGSAAPQPTKEATWTEVKSWKGSGAKKTEPFSISGKQWRIMWINNGGYMGVSVYKPGGSLPVELAVNTTDVGSDTSYIYKTGEFYLDINATGGWEVRVEELK